MLRSAFTKTSTWFAKSMQSGQCDQIRTTFVLKRRWPPALDKQDTKPKPLKSKNFVYDLVEVQDSKKAPDLKLILTSYVDGVGMKDDIVSVRPQFGRNNLLLPGLAIYASPENLELRNKRLAAKTETEAEKHSSRYSGMIQKELSHQILAIIVNKDNPWTIEKWHVRAAFRRAGFWVPDDAIEMYKPERLISGPNLDLEGKQFLVSVKINNFEQTLVRCKIHHWLTETLEDWKKDWRATPVPIFEEDADIFSTLPSLSK